MVCKSRPPPKQIIQIPIFLLQLLILIPFPLTMQRVIFPLNLHRLTPFHWHRRTPGHLHSRRGQPVPYLFPLPYTSSCPPESPVSIEPTNPPVLASLLRTLITSNPLPNLDFPVPLHFSLSR